MSCEKISVVYGECGCDLVRLEIENDYKVFQKLVFGCYDIIRLPGDLLLFVNDASKINGMEKNCVFLFKECFVDLVFGPFILCGRSGEECTSLPSNVKVYKKGDIVCCSQ